MNSIQLTQEIVRINTINPPGDEHLCAEYLGRYLENNGFEISYHEFAKNRTNLVARISGNDNKKPLCFTGHIDTVPLGAQSWSCDPFSGDISGDKMFGRGTSDMKSGVAAFVCAAVEIAKFKRPKAGLELVITAGEETGCEGANFLATSSGALTNAGAVVIGEPSSNYPLVGHKGAYWLKLIAKGITAHGSMLDKGDNAIYKLADAILKLKKYRWTECQHAVLGKPTLNVSTVHGGMNINSIPDKAEATVDVRTIPGQQHSIIKEDFADILGDDITIEEIVGVNGIWSEPDHSWVSQVFEIGEEIINEKLVAKGATYFTDGPALVEAYGGVPSIILGPGEAAMAHQTDEYCFIHRIEQATEYYLQIARKWCY